MDSSKQTGKKNLVVNGLPDHEYKKQHENNIRRVNNNAHAQGIQANGIEATNGSVTDARSHVSGSQNANGLSENHQLRVNGHVSDDTHIVISNRSVIVSQNNERQDNVSNGKIVGNNEKSNGTIQQREYTTRNVCELYRHENDVIFGRTRGGVLTENEVLVVDLDAESPVGTERQLARTLNGRQNSDEDDLRLDQSSSSSSHTAPLATPESFSDDEVVSTDCRENVDKKECKSTDGNTKHLVKKLKESIQNGHTDNNFCDQQDSDAFDVNFCNDEPLANDEMLPETTDKSENISNVDSIESLTVNESDGEEVGPENVEIPDNNQDIIEENILLEVLTEDVKSETSSNEGDGNFVDGIEEDLAMSDTGEGSEGSENNIDEGVCNVDNGELNDAPVGLLFDEEQAENDNNNDDLGDFIEADLPPNVERLAFFSRDSSSEEDEGCGDEVRPNNDEDVVSENETIDPTERDYMAPVHKVLNNSYEDGEHGSGNILSNREDCVRAELSNFYPCNITCDKSSEENDLDEDIDQTFMESQGAEGCSVVECSGCSMHNQASSFNRDKVSSSGKWETCGVCACCDRLVEVNCERQREMGVIVCDQCFREHSIEQKRWSENLTDFRRKPRPLSGSNSHQRSSSGSLTAGSNHFDKVSNNSPLYGRFSSSDSDPFDRIYVSDSSEMVSPEQEAAGEPFYHIAGALSNGESADVHQKEDNRSSTFPRQSVSLEFTNPDEVLYCPYYTRRSRSLDQCPVTAVGEEESNRLSEGEGPNIAVDSSNFQDDESNQQQKVFVKAAYNVSPLVPDCSSSDEEENIRVTETNQQELGGVDVINDHRFNQHGGQHGSYYMMHSDYGMYNGGTSQHSVSELQELRQKSRADESEPIYEDIDQLGLLLETTCAARDDTSDMMDTQPLCTAISKLRKRRSRGAVCDVEKVMIWKEYEAYLVQVKQIGTSACGPTAALNVLRAFDFQVDKEEVVQVIRSNLRMETAPIPYYLFSRYCAGTTADDLVMGIYRLTRGTIRGRFFHFHPHRDVQLLKWLGHWMKKGAVPVATLNLQRGVKPGWTIPDAWHHQMVYGVSSKGVYLTNPLEIVPEHVILEQLSSGSVLLVRRQDVVGRFRDWCPLNEILRQPDPRWRTMNVLGQVVHMLREQCMPLDQLVTMKTQLTSHIRIPVAYKAGISLFMRASSDHLHELMSCPELPVLDKNAGNTS